MEVIGWGIAQSANKEWSWDGCSITGLTAHLPRRSLRTKLYTFCQSYTKDDLHSKESVFNLSTFKNSTTWKKKVCKLLCKDASTYVHNPLLAGLNWYECFFYIFFWERCCFAKTKKKSFCRFSSSKYLLRLLTPYVFIWRVKGYHFSSHLSLWIAIAVIMTFS